MIHSKVKQIRYKYRYGCSMTKKLKTKLINNVQDTCTINALVSNTIEQQLSHNPEHFLPIKIRSAKS